ncbi:hypothetical protein STRDD13_01203 [Streptococcus sp. DD13]|nr:hypothetical protein STRDD13_01203 [Streptococcus sp. DD13]
MKIYLTRSYILTFAFLLYFVAIILKDVHLLHFTELVDSSVLVAIYAATCLARVAKPKERE